MPHSPSTIRTAKNRTEPFEDLLEFSNVQSNKNILAAYANCSWEYSIPRNVFIWPLLSHYSWINQLPVVGPFLCQLRVACIYLYKIDHSIWKKTRCQDCCAHFRMHVQNMELPINNINVHGNLHSYVYESWLKTARYESTDSFLLHISYFNHRNSNELMRSSIPLPPSEEDHL